MTKKLGVTFIYYSLPDNENYNFLLNENVFDYTTQLHIVYKSNNIYIDKDIIFQDLPFNLKNEDVIVVIGSKENYTIRVSAGELWVS